MMKVHFPEKKMRDFKKKWKSQITNENIKHIAKELSKHC